MSQVCNSFKAHCYLKTFAYIAIGATVLAFGIAIGCCIYWQRRDAIRRDSRRSSLAGYPSMTSFTQLTADKPKAKHKFGKKGKAAPESTDDKGAMTETSEELDHDDMEPKLRARSAQLLRSAPRDTTVAEREGRAYDERPLPASPTHHSRHDAYSDRNDSTVSSKQHVHDGTPLLSNDLHHHRRNDGRDADARSSDMSNNADTRSGDRSNNADYADEKYATHRNSSQRTSRSNRLQFEKTAYSREPTTRREWRHKKDVASSEDGDLLTAASIDSWARAPHGRHELTHVSEYSRRTNETSEYDEYTQSPTVDDTTSVSSDSRL